MSVEDILRAARKANGEIIDKRSAPPALKSPSPKYDAPQKWYEKKWGVGLLLITCFPLGVIEFAANPHNCQKAVSLLQRLQLELGNKA